MDLGITEPGNRTKHIKILGGIIFLLLGAIVFAQTVNLLPFTIGVNPNFLLQATSTGSLVGGLFMIASGLRRPF